MNICRPALHALGRRDRVILRGAALRHIKSMSFPASRHHDNVIP
jgi:hypothetical protein